MLRPDDIWFQILIQLNLCLQYDNHDTGHLLQPRYLLPPVFIDQHKRDAIHRSMNRYFLEHIQQPWLADWVPPGFSTSGPEDNAMAIAIILGWVFTSYNARPSAACGIPSITLLGTQDDWKHLSGKLYRIREFGPKANAYRMRLVRILDRIVGTFNDPPTPGTKQFWDKFVQARIKHGETRDRSPQYKISGWILSLFFFNDSGERDSKFASSQEACEKANAVELDGAWFGEVGLEDLPCGYAGILLKAPDGEAKSGSIFDPGWLVAGSIGKSIMQGAPRGYIDAAALVTSATTSGGKSWRSSNNAQDGVKSHENTNGRRRLSNVFRRLSCIGRRKEEAPAQGAPTPEQNSFSSAEEPAVMAQIEDKPDHSTIQPQSGWAVLRQGIRPRRYHSQPELQGTTVDAIETCESIEHHGIGRPLKYGHGSMRGR